MEAGKCATSLINDELREIKRKLESAGNKISSIDFGALARKLDYALWVLNG
jgi:hypothetical protein